ncbi:MAG: DsbA family protein [Alphaproteobacteria bacterium]|nr:DsbA family protein [Alphaproteobacteria bacterium]MCW5743084.1 DsbA family protein [Alphaproteobacteria bacterium]
MRRIRFYIDFKSPYAYLAKDPARDLVRETGAAMEWLPYTLDIPAYLGSARVDGSGDVLEESRNAHQWRRVKYSYMDCRREANRRGLVIRGTRKIFDSSLAHVGLLWAKRQGEAVESRFIDIVYEHFWKRELDIENPEVVAATLRECGADTAGFAAWLGGEGREELKRLQREAEDAGVFGVPSFLFDDGDLYWGREHIPHVRERLVSG